MSNMPKDIAEYLEDMALGTVGTTIFAGYMPDTPLAAVALNKTAGRPPKLSSGPKVRRPGLQVVIRGIDYDTAHNLSLAIDKALGGLVNAVIGTATYLHVQAVQEATCAGWDDETDTISFVQNFAVEMTEQE